MTEPKSGLPEASLGESVKFVAAGLLPALVRGLFSPRKGAMKLLTRLDADAKTTAVLRSIRAKHGGEGVRLLGGRIVTLWGPGAISEVLEKSADVYHSGSGAKAKGMSHFQPDALTLSHGDEWNDRRRFNESVLATKDPLHPDAARFLGVVAEEVERLPVREELDWDGFEQLFDKVTLRVVFGDSARDDSELTALLEKLMGEANRLVGLSTTDEYYEFYGKLERKLRDPEPGSLLARFADAPQSDRTRVVHQIPHMMFATRDTLGANTYRALALTVADPQVEAKVLASLQAGDLTDPSFMGGLDYLEGCLQEAMRLWPTVPMLARETTRSTELAGAELEQGTQVMILNTFNHRDVDQVPDANRLRPERWMNGSERNPKFNHLSGGSQYCPGIPLVLLLGKAVIANVLQRYKLTLMEPDLDASGELPHMLDFYSLRFGVAAR
jgi:cytochrome P450